MDARRAKTLVDVRVVDDLAGQVDVPIGKSSPRLIGVVDRTIHAVAEAEFAGEVNGQPAASIDEIAGFDLVDQIAVIALRQHISDDVLEVEPLAVNQRGGQRSPVRIGRT